MAKIKYTVNLDFVTNKASLDSIKKNIDLMKTKIDISLDTDKATKLKAEVDKLGDYLKMSLNENTNSIDFRKLDKYFKNANFDVAKFKVGLKEAGIDGAKAFNSIANANNVLKKEFQETHSLLTKFSATLWSTARWSISSSILNNLTSSIEKAYFFAKDLDRSLTDIRIVTNLNSKAVLEFADDANKAAKALKTTTLDYVDASLVYFQQGLAQADVEKMTKATIIGANIAGESAEQMSTLLTSAMNGYKLSADQAIMVTDKLAAVGATTAADFFELATGMSKVASMADTAGVTIDQLTGQLATIVSVTKESPESIGTSLKTIYGRMLAFKNNTTSMMEDEDGEMFGAPAAEAAIAKFATATGKQISLFETMKDGSRQMRDLGTVIDEIGNAWQNTTDQEVKFGLATALAGSRQQNRLIALFNSWEMYKEAMQTSMDAEGTAYRQNEKFMNSYTGRLKTLQATSERLYMNLINPEAMKDSVSSLTKIVEVVTTGIDKIGNLNGLLGIFGALVTKPAMLFIFQSIKTIMQDLSIVMVKNNQGLQQQQQEASRLASISRVFGEEKARQLNDEREKLQAIVSERQKELELAQQLTDLRDFGTKKTIPRNTAANATTAKPILSTILNNAELGKTLSKKDYNLLVNYNTQTKLTKKEFEDVQRITEQIYKNILKQKGASADNVQLAQTMKEAAESVLAPTEENINNLYKQAQIIEGMSSAVATFGQLYGAMSASVADDSKTVFDVMKNGASMLLLMIPQLISSLMTLKTAFSAAFALNSAGAIGGVAAFGAAGGWLALIPLIIGAATFAYSAIKKIQDKSETTYEEHIEILDKLQTKIQNFQSEYETLKAKVKPTADEKNRLRYLEKQIELEEELSRIEKERAGKQYIEEFTKETGGKTYRKGSDVFTTETKSQLKDAIKLLGDFRNAQREATDAMSKSSDEYEKATEKANGYKQQLFELYSKMSAAQQESGVPFEGQMLDFYNDLTLALGLVTDYKNEIKTLNTESALLDETSTKLANAQSLTRDEVDELLARYPSLEGHIIQTANGWTIEKKVLGEVQTGVGQLSEAYVGAQKAMSIITQEGALARIGLSLTELETIETVADAYRVMAETTRKKATIAGGGVEDFTTRQLANQYAQDEAWDAVVDLGKFKEKINSLINDIYKSPGIGTEVGEVINSDTSKDIDKATKSLGDLATAVDIFLAEKKDLLLADEAIAENLQKQIDNEDDYAKKLLLENQLLYQQTKIKDKVVTINQEISAEAQKMRNKYESQFGDLDKWFTATGEASADYLRLRNKLITDGNKKELENVELVFSELQKLKKAWYENKDVVDQYNDAILEIKENISAIIDQGLDQIGSDLENALTARKQQLEEEKQAADDLYNKIKESLKEQKSKYEEIQQTIQDTYEPQLDALDEAIDKIEEQAKTQEDTIKNNYKLQKKALEDNYKLQKKIIEETYDPQIDLAEKTLDEYKKQLEIEKDINKEKELTLELEKAKLNLLNTSKEKNTRILNEQGQWEWVANPQAMKSAQEALIEAEQNLTDFYKEQEQQRVIDELEAQIESLENARDYAEDQLEITTDAAKEQLELVTEAAKEQLAVQTKAQIDSLISQKTAIQEKYDAEITGINTLIENMVIKLDELEEIEGESFVERLEKLQAFADEYDIQFKKTTQDEQELIDIETKLKELAAIESQSQEERLAAYDAFAQGLIGKINGIEGAALAAQTALNTLGSMKATTAPTANTPSGGGNSSRSGTNATANIPGIGVVPVTIINGKVQENGLPEGTIVNTAGGNFKITGGTGGAYSGVKVNDEGGLNYGKGFMLKDVVEPERVLSPEQTQSFEKLVSYLPNLIKSKSLSPNLNNYNSSSRFSDLVAKLSDRLVTNTGTTFNLNNVTIKADNPSELVREIQNIANIGFRR